jgi:hypothetical protein
VPDDLPFARVLVDFLALRFDERHNLDAMLAAANDAAECFPCIEREHVLARLDLGLRDTLGRESLVNRRKVCKRLAGDSARECSLPVLGFLALGMVR